MKNYRDNERVLLKKFALLKLKNGTTIEGQTRNMSVGGAYIEYEADIELLEGTECNIQITLDEENKDLTAEIYANIMYRDDDGVGCRFLKVNAIYYQFIRTLRS